MYTVKLRNLSNDITEDDIFSVMQRFGEIIKVKIPQEELRNGKFRNRGFGFVTFKTIECASRALEQREVTVEFATLEIEKALKKPMLPREGGGDPRKFPSEFDQLKRRT